MKVAKYERAEEIYSTLEEKKLDKEDGKALSSNDFTDTLKTKLDGIASGANKTTVDSSLSTTSTNPVQNKVINSALDGKLSTSGGTMTGRITSTSSIKSSWINGKTNAAILNITAIPNDTNYSPLIRGESYSGNVWSFGQGVFDAVGFYGYLKDTTENRYDWSVRIGLDDGVLHSTFGFRGALEGTADSAKKLIGFSSGENSLPTWGHLIQNNNYAPVYLAGTASGGGIAFADKNKQTSMQIDGTFWQNEGRYELLDTNTGALKSHTHNYAGSDSAGGVAKSAIKLSPILSVDSGSTVKYPYKRFASFDSDGTSYVDAVQYFLISGQYTYAPWGILKISVRINNISNKADPYVNAEWLACRNNNPPEVKIGLIKNDGKSKVDFFIKVGAYARMRMILLNQSSTLIKNYSSNENSTQTILEESYKTLDDAATEIRNQAYDQIIDAVNVNIANALISTSSTITPSSSCVSSSTTLTYQKLGSNSIQIKGKFRLSANTSSTVIATIDSAIRPTTAGVNFDIFDNTSAGFYRGRVGIDGTIMVGFGSSMVTGRDYDFTVNYMI